MRALDLHESGLSGPAIGLLFTLTLAGDAGITLWITTTADRIGRKRMLVLGAALMVMAGAVFGLTGNIATGKSTVAKMLEELGATVIDADALVHELQQQGTPVFNDIVTAFGAGILDRAGEIDRKVLGAIVLKSRLLTRFLMVEPM